MPDIVGLNFGLVKSTPDLTDLLPIQSIDGITHPTPISGVVAATIASTGFTTKVNQLIGSGSGGIADGDKGDITVSGSGAVWSIDANAVTLAKMTPIATSRLLGRASAGSGSVEAITIGNGLTLTGTTLSSTAVSGGSGGLSPWITKTANYTAIAGDRLRIDASAGDVVITLPASPTATDADIWLQRLDTSANKVLIRSGSNKLNALVNQDGVFAPTVVQLIERLSYVDAMIGWLGQYDRLTYQSGLPAGSTALSYTSDGDINGLFYYLGTTKLTAAFTNPQFNGSITAVASSTEGGSVQLLSDRTSNQFYSNNAANSWVAFNITDNSKIAISKYTIRSRPSNASQQLRSWVLEGTNTVTTFDVTGINAATWVPIDTRNNDATLVNADQYYTLTANGSTTPFRYLRFRQTGLNASSADYLVLGELEFYGIFSIS